MISEGVLLMAVGMTTVFGFLILLVGLMLGSAAFFEAFADRFATPEAPAEVSQAADEQDIAIVLAAIEAHQRGRSGTGA